MSAVHWISEQHEDGALAFRVGRRGDDLVAEFVGLATLYASRDGRELAFEPSPGADAIDLAKVRASLVPALLRHASGRLTLHGAAVARGGRAVSLLGPSGAGKSTLAATLCADQGASLVADDTTALDFDGAAVRVTPTERVHWLVKGSLEPCAADVKKPVAPARMADARQGLNAVCALAFEPTLQRPELRRLRGQAALARLVPNVIRLVVDEPAAQVWELSELGRLVERVAVYELVRPKGLDGQRESARLVASLLAPGEDGLS